MVDVVDVIDEARIRLEDARAGIDRLAKIQAEAEKLGMLDIQKKAALAEKAVSDSVEVIEGLADSVAALIQGVAGLAENV